MREAGDPARQGEKEEREVRQMRKQQEERKDPGRRPPAPRPGGQKPGKSSQAGGETVSRGRPLRRQGGGMAALSALAREARRRRMTYGTLCRTLTEEEREAVVRAWQAEHSVPAAEACQGCVYWRDCSSTAPEAGRMCHFALDRGHMRRRDGERCLEYRGEEARSGAPASAWRAEGWVRAGQMPER